MFDIRHLMASLALITMSATTSAQILDDSENGQVKTGSITHEGSRLYWFDEEIEACPSVCYTDMIQRTVIRCEADLGRVGRQRSINDRGEYVGSFPQWRKQAHHAIIEKSVRDEGCVRSVQDPVIDDLGNQAMYFPGDQQIQDTRTMRDLGLQPFDCNDHYPTKIDRTKATPIMFTELKFDLLIERLWFTCH